MLKASINFFTCQLNGQLLISETWTKRHNNEQIAQGDFRYTVYKYYALTKSLVCFYSSG